VKGLFQRTILLEQFLKVNLFAFEERRPTEEFGGINQDKKRGREVQ